MRISKRFLVATTALTLSMSVAAHADDNKAFLEQIGSDNSASVDQSLGNTNQAGGVQGGSTAAGNAMLQDGNNNALNIVQSGDDNFIGVSRSGNGNGVTQTGNDNSATVTQSSVTNVVNVIEQTANSFFGSTGNELTITQSSVGSTPRDVGGPLSGDGNLLTAVRQTSIGPVKNSVTVSQNVNVANTSRYTRNQIGGNQVQNENAGLIFEDSNLNQGNNGIVQVGSGNMANLTQDGTRNFIQLVDQRGGSNQATATQNGAFNMIATIDQDGGLFGGFNNSANVSQSGFGNGRDGLTLPNAGSVGATSSSVIQNGDDNSVTYSAQGDSNEFGFTQIGTFNTVGSVLITGSGNQTAGYQAGVSNTITIAPIVGDDNDVGVRQVGAFNQATLELTNGSDRNALLVDQTGAFNDADIFVEGDDNFASLTQIGTNGFTLSMSGDENNNTTLSGTFGGNAASVGLTEGVFTQDGLGNSFAGDIAGSNNLMAALQDGNFNTITASVTGDGNQSAVSQMGNFNTASYTQSGGTNNAGIMQ
ncbi:hypothetical protein SM764_03350 [Pseudophaeobacter sp. 1A16562]|uniref:beta strand repeat-containing protein n=1 Tax=Pseudophaeobacter sp. 1A16562 TaxID=3098143 RepID=UPI0034D766BD